MGLDLTGNLVFAVIAASIGAGFQHGYHTGVLNVPQEVLTDWINVTLYHKNSEEYMSSNQLKIIWGLTTSLMNIGGTIGGLTSGIVATQFGPKCGLFINNNIVIVASVLMAGSKWINMLEALSLGRFVIGVACGLFAGLCPLYLSEIATVSLRGAIGSIYQLVLTISILIAQFVGFNFMLGTPQLWEFLFILPVVFVIIQDFLLYFCPESPKYLVAKNKEENALIALRWLRESYHVFTEMDNIKAENDELERVRLGDMFQEAHLWKPLCISLGIMAAQQLCGINAVIFYSTSTFMSAGLSHKSAQFATLGVGIINVLTTIASVVLVEIAGRKALLLVGFGGMSIVTFLLTICLQFSSYNVFFLNMSVLLVFIYIILFATGPGSIPWFLVTELFNYSAHSTAISLTVPLNWIVNFVVTMTFPVIEHAIGPYVFLIFVFLDVIFFLLILNFIPETKNKTIWEITQSFK